MGELTMGENYKKWFIKFSFYHYAFALARKINFILDAAMCFYLE